MFKKYTTFTNPIHSKTSAGVQFARTQHQDRRSAYNVALRRVNITIVTIKKATMRSLRTIVDLHAAVNNIKSSTVAI